MPAPVVLFAFNRPEHLARTLQALAANELAAESDLVIICDGPRNDAERELTDAVRRVARAAAGFRSCAVIEREKNYGLAVNIIAGVTAMFERHERLVVLEDDLLTSPYFLRYMNDGLALYAETVAVASIHGYCFPHENAPKNDTFFLRGADCLGWATWKRAWRHFNPDAMALLAEIRRRREVRAFNRQDHYEYTDMLQAAATGEVSSWAVRWLASAWLKNMYTLYPRESLVFHIGSDGSGTHCGTDTLHDVSLTKSPISVYAVPVREDNVMARELCKFLSTLSKGPLRVRMRRLKRFVRQTFSLVYSSARSLKRSIYSFYEGYCLLHLYAYFKTRNAIPLVMLGTQYDGWSIPENCELNSRSVCYLAGAGEDISFDCELVRRFACRVHIFDPTPRAQHHFMSLKDAVENGKKICANNSDYFYDIDATALRCMEFHPWGIADTDSEVKFYFPKDAAHVSCSSENIQDTKDFFLAQCFRLRTIQNMLRDEEIDLIKIDIEGAEYSVIRDMIDSGLCPRIFSVEFHKLHKTDSAAPWRIFQAIRLLEKHGLKLIHMNHLDATFMRLHS